MQIDALGPSDFRTRGALERTMQHLRALMDRKEPSFAKIHNFLFDRYRSVRQDLYVQGIEVRAHWRLQPCLTLSRGARFLRLPSCRGLGPPVPRVTLSMQGYRVSGLPVPHVALSMQPYKGSPFPMLL